MRPRFDRRAPGTSAGARSSVTGDFDSDVFGSSRRFERLADGLERATIVRGFVGDHGIF